MEKSKNWKDSNLFHDCLYPLLHSHQTLGANAIAAI